MATEPTTRRPRTNRTAASSDRAATGAARPAEVATRAARTRPATATRPAADEVVRLDLTGFRRVEPRLPDVFSGSGLDLTPIASYERIVPDHSGPSLAATRDMDCGRPGSLGWKLVNAHTKDARGNYILAANDLDAVKLAMRPIIEKIVIANDPSYMFNGQIGIEDVGVNRDAWAQLMAERKKAGLPMYESGYVAVKVGGPNGWESAIHPNDLNGGASGGLNVADDLTGASQHRPTARVQTSLQSYLADNGNKTALNKKSLDDLSTAIEGDRGIELHWSSYPTAVTRGGAPSYDTSYRRPAANPAIHTGYSVYVVKPGSTSPIGGAIQIGFNSNTTLNDVADMLNRGLSGRI